MKRKYESDDDRGNKKKQKTVYGDVTIEDDSDDSDWDIPPPPPPPPPLIPIIEEVIEEEEYDEHFPPPPPDSKPPEPLNSKKKEPMSEKKKKEVESIVKRQIKLLLNVTDKTRYGKWQTMAGSNRRVLMLSKQEYMAYRIKQEKEQRERREKRLFMNRDWTMTFLYGCRIDTNIKDFDTNYSCLQHRQLIWRYSQLVAIFNLIKESNSANPWVNEALNGLPPRKSAGPDPLNGMIQPGDLALSYFSLFPSNWLESPFQLWSQYLQHLEESGCGCWPFPASGNIEEGGNRPCQCPGWKPCFPPPAKKITEDAKALYYITTIPEVKMWMFGKKQQSNSSELVVRGRNVNSVYYSQQPLHLRHELTEQYFMRECFVLKFLSKTMFATFKYDSVYNLYYYCKMGDFAELGHYCPTQMIYATYFMYIDWNGTGQHQQQQQLLLLTNTGRELKTRLAIQQ